MKKFRVFAKKDDSTIKFIAAEDLSQAWIKVEAKYSLISETDVGVEEVTVKPPVVETPTVGSSRNFNEAVERRAALVADCVSSLDRAIQFAGGTVGAGYLDMTVREFIARIAAQNYIRFVYKREEED